MVAEVGSNPPPGARVVAATVVEAVARGVITPVAARMGAAPARVVMVISSTVEGTCRCRRDREPFSYDRDAVILAGSSFVDLERTCV